MQLQDGAVLIAAITSCTNTSNPYVMLGAGLLARNARKLGLTAKPWVKTSLAPGSRVVTDYYRKAELLDDLAAVGFDLVGYGCTTCIGNSGPLRPEISAAVKAGDVIACAVLSGNRNFEGRVHAEVRMNFLASPPLVVAYALAGTLDVDLATEPLGMGSNGQPVFLKDIWPSPQEVQDTVLRAIDSKMFRDSYATVFKGDENWSEHQDPAGQRLRLGQGFDLREESALLRGHDHDARRRSVMCMAHARWPCSAIRSPPTTSPRPATSPRPVPRPATSSSRACSRSTSTPTVRAAATTRS